MKYTEKQKERARNLELDLSENVERKPVKDIQDFYVESWLVVESKLNFDEPD